MASQLLALNGLRVSDATGADIEHLCLERGHRTLTITRKGGKVVTIPLAPRTARAIDLAIGERAGGPVFLAADGRRLDRHATYIVAYRRRLRRRRRQVTRRLASASPGGHPPGEAWSAAFGHAMLSVLVTHRAGSSLPIWAGFGWSCIKMLAEQFWVICAGAAAIRLVDVTRSVNAEWASKAARRGGNRGSRAYSATVSSLATHSGSATYNALIEAVARR